MYFNHLNRPKDTGVFLSSGLRMGKLVECLKNRNWRIHLQLDTKRKFTGSDESPECLPAGPSLPGKKLCLQEFLELLKLANCF